MLAYRVGLGFLVALAFLRGGIFAAVLVLIVGTILTPVRNDWPKGGE